MSRESFVYAVFRMDLMLDRLRQITSEPIIEAKFLQWREEHRNDSDSFSAYMGQYRDIYHGA